MLIYVGWRELEPRQGVYDWDFLDKVVKVAAKNKVFYKLSVVTGFECPDWIYESGIEVFPATKGRERGPRSANYGEPTRIPLPWGEKYLEHFERVLRKVAERYAEDERFYAVALTGSGYRFDEMHLPWKKDDLKRWASYGDYKAKLVKMYKHLIDSFATIFPHQQICPHIKPPLPGMRDELRQIIEYGVNKYPDRFTLQNNQLGGKSDNTGNITYRIIMEHNDKVHNGFQAGRSFVKRPEAAGSLQQLIANYVRVDSEYFEVWWDVQFPSFIDQFMSELKAAQSLGYEKYKDW